MQLEIKDLEQICAGDLDIRITGFNDAELDQIINLGDTVPADPKVNHIPFIPEDEIVSVLGDIWQIGPHRIICGNSLEESTFNQLMDGVVADTVLQDPPYNVKINGHVCGSGAIHHKEFAMASGEMSAEEFINFLKQNFFLAVMYSTPRGISKTRQRLRIPRAFIAGVIARQTDPRPRDGSATTRFVVNGSSPRSTASTEAKKLFKSMQR